MEIYPSLRNPVYIDVLFLLEIDTSDNKILQILREWIDSENGKSARSKLSQRFQETVGYEELFFGLGIICILLAIKGFASETKESSPKLARLEDMLNRETNESASYLCELFLAWDCATKSRAIPGRTTISTLLGAPTDANRKASPDMVKYWEGRLSGQSHSITMAILTSPADASRINP